MEKQNALFMVSCVLSKLRMPIVSFTYTKKE